jgi:hypothetical protein
MLSQLKPPPPQKIRHFMTLAIHSTGFYDGKTITSWQKFRKGKYTQFELLLLCKLLKSPFGLIFTVNLQVPEKSAVYLKALSLWKTWPLNHQALANMLFCR